MSNSGGASQSRVSKLLVEKESLMKENTRLRKIIAGHNKRIKEIDEITTPHIEQKGNFRNPLNKEEYYVEVKPKKKRQGKKQKALNFRSVLEKHGIYRNTDKIIQDMEKSMNEEEGVTKKIKKKKPKNTRRALPRSG
jgi:hypothetical protein